MTPGCDAAMLPHWPGSPRVRRQGSSGCLLGVMIHDSTASCSPAYGRCGAAVLRVLAECCEGALLTMCREPLPCSKYHVPDVRHPLSLLVGYVAGR